MNEIEKVKTYLTSFKCPIACFLEFILFEMPRHLTFSCRLQGCSLIFFLTSIHSKTVQLCIYKSQLRDSSYLQIAHSLMNGNHYLKKCNSHHFQCLFIHSSTFIRHFYYILGIVLGSWHTSVYKTSKTPCPLPKVKCTQCNIQVIYYKVLHLKSI